MLIKVLCNDKSRGLVEDCNLKSLIERNLVAAYYCPHTNEWVDVEFSLIRRTANTIYHGSERRGVGKQKANSLFEGK